jgi:cysteine synthase
MRFLGAKVVITPAAERGMGMVKKAVELAKAHGWLMTRQFESEAMPTRTRAPRRVRSSPISRANRWIAG